MKVTATTFPRKSRSERLPPSWVVSVNSGAGPIFARRAAPLASWPVTRAAATHIARTASAATLQSLRRLTLAMQLASAARRRTTRQAPTSFLPGSLEHRVPEGPEPESLGPLGDVARVDLIPGDPQDSDDVPKMELGLAFPVVDQLVQDHVLGAREPRIPSGNQRQTAATLEPQAIVGRIPVHKDVDLEARGGMDDVELPPGFNSFACCLAAHVEVRRGKPGEQRGHLRQPE